MARGRRPHDGERSRRDDARLPAGNPFDPLGAFRVLQKHRVRFVAIGGVAAGLHGSPTLTADLDICYERSRMRDFASRADSCRMPLDCLLFIADAGNGDLFGYAIINGKVARDHIYAWNHEDDSRKWVAPSLRVFLDWLPLGKIKT